MGRQTISHEPAQFRSEGLTITCTVCAVQDIADGSVAFLIRSSRADQHVENWHTFAAGSLISLETLRNAQQCFAEQFARNLRGLAESHVFPSVLISNPIGNANPICVVAGVDLSNPITLVHPELLRFLCAQMQPHPSEYGGQNLGPATFQLRIQFGSVVLNQVVYASPNASHGFMCVLGNDFRDALRDLDWQLSRKLVEDNVAKAYRLGTKGRENTVLLIGSYQREDREQLSEISGILFSRGYRSLILDEFPDISDHSLEQKLLFLSSISKFALCMDSSASGHYVELSICARFGVITALLANGEKPSTAMLYDLKVRNRFAEVFDLCNDDIGVTIDKVLVWAAQISTEKKSLYDDLYPWRPRSST